MTRASSLASSLIGKTVSGAALNSPVMRAAIALFKLVSKANVGSRPDSGSFPRHVSLPAKRLHQIVVENARVEIHPLSDMATHLVELNYVAQSAQPAPPSDRARSSPHLHQKRYDPTRTAARRLKVGLFSRHTINIFLITSSVRKMGFRLFSRHT